MRKRRIQALCILLMTLSLVGCRSHTDHDSSVPATPKETAVSDFAGASECSQFANDSGVYIEDESRGGYIRQWSFDGTLLNQFRVMRETNKLEFSDLLSVKNDKVVYRRTNWKTDRDEIVLVPIQENEDGQYLDVDHQKKLLEIEIGDIGYSGSYGTPLFFYMNEDYMIYLRDYYSEGGMAVYDLKEGKEVNIKNLPEQKKKAAEGSRDTIYQFTDAMASVYSQVCGDRIIFNTEPIGNKKYGAPYGFSVYRLGEDHVTAIDERCYTAAAYITDPERQKVYYQIETDQSIWEYDCKSGEKRERISEQELKDCCEGAGLSWQEGEDDDSLFLQGDTLYIIRSKSDLENTEIVSYDLQGEQGLTYEQRVTQELERWVEIVEWNEGYLPDGALTILQGKLLYSNEEACFCIDLETAEGKQIVRGDEECIYYMMASGCQAEASDYYETDQAKWSRKESARAEKQKKKEEKAAARRDKFRQQEKRAAKLSVEEQLIQLAQKMRKQYRKWDHTGKEEWCGGVYYTVTDLDHNGVLELLLSTGSQGSGGYTTTAIYEAGTDGKAVTVQKPYTGEDFVEITVTGDIVNPVDTAYYDAERDIWHYVTQDYISGGYRAKGHGDNVWSLKEGETESENICGYYEDTDHKSKQYKTTYYKVVGEEPQEITKSEYHVDRIMEEHFPDCEKYRVSISWGRMKRKKMLTASQSLLYQKLTASYQTFNVKKGNG